MKGKLPTSLRHRRRCSRWPRTRERSSGTAWGGGATALTPPWGTESRGVEAGLGAEPAAEGTWGKARGDGRTRGRVGKCRHCPPRGAPRCPRVWVLPTCWSGRVTWGLVSFCVREEHIKSPSIKQWGGKILFFVVSFFFFPSQGAGAGSQLAPWGARPWRGKGQSCPRGERGLHLTAPRGSSPGPHPTSASAPRP